MMAEIGLPLGHNRCGNPQTAHHALAAACQVHMPSTSDRRCPTVDTKVVRHSRCVEAYHKGYHAG
jgi:hypothetical protein